MYNFIKLIIIILISIFLFSRLIHNYELSTNQYIINPLEILPSVDYNIITKYPNKFIHILLNNNSIDTKSFKLIVKLLENDIYVQPIIYTENITPSDLNTSFAKTMNLKNII